MAMNEKQMQKKEGIEYNSHQTKQIRQPIILL